MPIKIIIPYGEKEIRVTPQEARELLNALEEIQDEFAVKDTVSVPFVTTTPSWAGTCTCDSTASTATCPVHGYNRSRWAGSGQWCLCSTSGGHTSCPVHNYNFSVL